MESSISELNLKKFVTLCGRKIHADVRYFPKTEHKGRTLIFCTDSCLNAFKADPEKFYQAHRNKTDSLKA
ncbi:MAG: hypothetical protein Kow002_08830 [Anaerolineales bacterium]